MHAIHGRAFATRFYFSLSTYVLALAPARDFKVARDFEAARARHHAVL